jgi:hypothetical protein
MIDFEHVILIMINFDHFLNDTIESAKVGYFPNEPIFKKILCFETKSFKKFFRIGTDIKIVHFMGHHKPWHYNKGVTPMPCFWSLWQSIYHEKVREHIPAELVSVREKYSNK